MHKKANELNGTKVASVPSARMVPSTTPQNQDTAMANYDSQAEATIIRRCWDCGRRDHFRYDPSCRYQRVQREVNWLQMELGRAQYEIQRLQYELVAQHQQYYWVLPKSAYGTEYWPNNQIR